MINRNISPDATTAHDPGALAAHWPLQRYVGADLSQVDALLQTTTSSRFEEVEELCRSATALGGKRLRPTLVLLAAQVVAASRMNQRQRRDLTAIAASVELVHAASLVHDDVLDGASQRRHQPTVVQRAGNSAAVLLGDLLFTRAYALAARCSSTYPARRIAAASSKLCVGELRQQSSAGNWSLSRQEYRSILLQKTGALCGVSCRLGAWCAGADQGQARKLAQFGCLLGLAFQIYDDWLDYWGTEQAGKTLGTDLVQLKPTLPLIRLLESAEDTQKLRLAGLLQRGGTEDLLVIRQELDRSDAAEFTLRAAKKCVDRAKHHLRRMPISPALNCLLAVADYSVHRTH